MNKSLYQILGVDAKASTGEIEAAYSRKLEELKMASQPDSSRLLALQQSRDVLANPVQRAAYDRSVVQRELRAISPVQETPEPTFMQRWGIWIAVSLFVVAGTWWLKRIDPITPFEKQQAASRSAERVRLPTPPANQPTLDLPQSIPVATAPAEAPPNPIAGEWACANAITGRTSKYNFLRDGSLKISTDDGKSTDYKYDLTGKVLSIGDASQSNKLAVEELVAKKIILNTGAQGERLVCRR